MLKKLAFAWSVWKFYRAARKEGLDPEAAKARAIDEALDQQLATDGFAGDEAAERKRFTKELLSASNTRDDPEAAMQAVFQQELDKRFPSQGDGPDPADISDEVAELLTDVEWDDRELPTAVNAQDLALIRLFKFDWDTAEVGAPMVSSETPLGERDLLAQLRAHYGTEDDVELVKRYIGLMRGLNALMAYGTLATGRYARPVTGIEADTLQDISGKALDDDVEVTDAHIKALRTVSFEWTGDAEDRLDIGEWPAPTMDAKRPYGDMTFYQIDLAKAVGRLPERQEDFDDALASEMTELHHHLASVIPVFVANAEIATTSDPT